VGERVVPEMGQSGWISTTTFVNTLASDQTNSQRIYFYSTLVFQVCDSRDTENEMIVGAWYTSYLSAVLQLSPRPAHGYPASTKIPSASFASTPRYDYHCTYLERYLNVLYKVLRVVRHLLNDPNCEGLVHVQSDGQIILKYKPFHKLNFELVIQIFWVKRWHGSIFAHYGL
jgi:hypothetical protein